MLSKAVEKYLTHYAEPEATQLGSAKRTFGHAVVIPALDESDALKSVLSRIPGGPLGEILVVLVVNATASAGAEVHDRSQALIRELKQVFGVDRIQGSGQALHWLAHPRGALVVVDRSSPGHHLPEGQGVGLARKIGCDIALSLWQGQRLHSRWIHTTDADVVLPSDYFDRAHATATEQHPSALLFPFWHELDRSLELAGAMRLYELYLRYYVLGLAYAGSPYAYQSLGSTLAVDAISYAKVRGFPMRAAAEDFYILNKLAKVGDILSLQGNPIRIMGRASNRVPFGTGRSLAQIVALHSQAEAFRAFAPEVYEYLKLWLEVLNSLGEGAASKSLAERIQAQARGTRVDPKSLIEALEPMDVDSAIAQARLRSVRPGTLNRHLHTWFDGFRTLKLLRSLERTSIGRRPLIEALRAAPFTATKAAACDDLDALRQELASDEARLPGRNWPRRDGKGLANAQSRANC